MIFKIKYNFVILELIGQPYFDLKRKNSKMYEINASSIVLESIHSELKFER